LRPLESVLCMETMHYADEVVGVDEFSGLSEPVKVGERELKTAQQLVDSLTAPFEPEQLHDEYREAVMRMIDRKAEGEEIVVQPAVEEEAPEVVDLVQALEASLAEAKKQKKKRKAA
jgi:DNA end-binding protein Ku